MLPAGPRRVIYIAIAANLGIAISKFVVAALSASSAMAAEGIHSTVDTANELLLLLGNRRADRPADAAHPFGYGKAVYFWALIVAVSMFVLGGGLSVCKGILDMLHPSAPADPVWSYVVLTIAAAFEGASWYVSRKELLRHGAGNRSLWQRVRSSKDPSVFSVFVEDSAALIGIAVAFAGVFLGHRLNNAYLDPAASVLIGLGMIAAAVILARETGALLVGEGMDQNRIHEIRQIIAADCAVDAVGDVLTMQLGPRDVLLTADVRFKRTLCLDDLETAVDRMQGHIRQSYPSVGRMCFQLTNTRSGEPNPS
jgi:cation diffusion facilitator family transporter